MSGRISIDNLSDSLKEMIANSGMTEEQIIELLENEEVIDSLKTDSKSIVGAINELFQSANNGKELIASAIGEPVSAEDTFSAMSSDINSLLSTFKTNMMNNGISVESGDKFKSLIDKIATLTDNEGKGVQIANGITKTALATKSFSNAVGSSTTSFSYIEIRNLTFVPQIILAFAQNGYGGYNTFTMYNTFSMYPERVYIVLSQPGGTAGGSVKMAIHANSCNINSTGFTIPVNTYGTTSEDCYWVAVGVGEEDTTLRDSLASILENKGVDVTEEDDIASLIGKVDDMTSNMIKYKSGIHEHTYDGNVRISFEVTGIGFRPTFVQVCRVNKTQTDGGYIFWINNDYMYDSNSIYIPVNSIWDIKSTSYKGLNAGAKYNEIVVNDDGFSLNIIVGGTSGDLWHFEWFVLG
jgi:hypothetical protein